MNQRYVESRGSNRTSGRARRLTIAGKAWYHMCTWYGYAVHIHGKLAPWVSVFRLGAQVGQIESVELDVTLDAVDASPSPTIPRIEGLEDTGQKRSGKATVNEKRHNKL